jgi:phospholipase/carboxylesterase
VQTTPVFLAHGTDDAIVPVAMARAANEALTRAGAKLTWHEYPMPHSVCPEEVRDIAAWLTALLH